MYSITDRPSFEYAARSLSELKQLQNHPASYLIGNKADLDHLRAVTESEAAKLAASHSIGFCEVSVAENSPALYKAFEKLIFESRARPTKQRKFSVSKMIGKLLFSSLLCIASTDYLRSLSHRHSDWQWSRKAAAGQPRNCGALSQGGAAQVARDEAEAGIHGHRIAVTKRIGAPVDSVLAVHQGQCQGSPDEWVSWSRGMN